MINVTDYTLTVDDDPATDYLGLTSVDTLGREVVCSVPLEGDLYADEEEQKLYVVQLDRTVMEIDAAVFVQSPLPPPTPYQEHCLDQINRCGNAMIEAAMAGEDFTQHSQEMLHWQALLKASEDTRGES